MEVTKKSRKGCFIALGIVGVVIVIVIIGIYILFLKVKDFGEDYLGVLGVSPKMMAEVEELNRDFPFEKPEDYSITEDQIIRFIAIKQNFADRIKEYEKEFKKLDEAEAQGESGFQEFRQAIKILAEVRNDFIEALRKNEMSPQEYRFLSVQIYTSYLGLAQQGIERDAGFPTEYNEENIELLNKYQDKLKELNTSGFEFWGITLWGGEE